MGGWLVDQIYDDRWLEYEEKEGYVVATDAFAFCVRPTILWQITWQERMGESIVVNAKNMDSSIP